VDIVQVGDPVLRRRAQRVPEELRTSPFVRQLVVTMVEVMRAAPGVGLAAPQVGESLQILVMGARWWCGYSLKGLAVSRVSTLVTRLPANAS